MEKPDQFVFQLEAPMPGKRREVAPHELAAETQDLRAVAAWAAGMQQNAG